MRIIHLVNHCIRGHGNVHVAVDLACQQVKAGNQVLYLSEGGNFESLLKFSGVEHRSLIQKSNNPLRIAQSLARLVKEILVFKPDIIHAHMMSGAVLGYIATRLTLRPLLTTIHNSFDGHSDLMKLGDVAVAVSNAEREKLIARGFDKKRTISIVNGPLGGARLAQLQSEQHFELMRPSISTVCGLHVRKGVGDLVKAFSLISERFPGAHLNIVGDGPDRQMLAKLCEVMRLTERVTFHGGLDNPFVVLKATDIFVLASHREPLGLVNLEARFAGCALVGTDVDGIPEALDFGKAGILTPPSHPAALADALAALLENPEKLSSFKFAAQQNLSRFSIEHFEEQYKSAYEVARLRRKLL